MSSMLKTIQKIKFRIRLFLSKFKKAKPSPKHIFIYEEDK